MEDEHLPPLVDHLLLHSMIELLIRLAAFLMACAAIYLIAQARSPRRRRKSSKRVRVSAAHQELENQLLILVGGSRETLVRLLKHTYQSHPKRSYQWCLEKTIRDLERDRRS